MSNPVLQRKPQKLQNLSFQLILVNFTAPIEKIPQVSNLKLSIVRGKQVFEQTKDIPIQSNQGTVSLNRTRLNFMVFSYDASKAYDFFLKINLNLMGEQKWIGECLIDCNSYAQVFLNNQNGAFQQTFYISPEEKIQVELYVEKNRFALEKIVRQINVTKDKSKDAVEPHKFQRITDRTSKFGHQLPLSPKRWRSRQNPYKRNSPKLVRQQEKPPSKVRQKFTKELQIRISPNYSIISKKSQIIKEEPAVKQQQPAPKQELVVKQGNVTRQETVQIQKVQARKEVVSQQQTVLKQSPIQSQQAYSKPVQILVDNNSRYVQAKIESQVPQTKVIVLQQQSPIQPSKQIKPLSQAGPSVPIKIQSKPIVIEQVKVTLSESPIVKSQFKIQQATIFLKTQHEILIADQYLKIDEKNVHIPIQETDKPILHSINDESAKKYPLKQEEQSKFNMKQQKKLISQSIEEDQNRLVMKRVSIFKTMPFKVKILLSFLAILFLLVSNYVQEIDAEIILPAAEIQTTNSTIIQLQILQPIQKHKKKKKSVDSQRNNRTIQMFQEAVIIKEQITLNTQQKVNKKKGKVLKSK